VAAGETIIPSLVSGIFFSENSEALNSRSFQEYLGIINDLENGLSIKQIAVKMRLSDSSIEKKLQKIRKCYRVKTNYELIHKTLTQRLPQF